MNEYDLPSIELQKMQSDWLAPARARALRQASIGQRRKVLDLACGYGVVTEELKRRSAGEVVALDCRQNALKFDDKSFADTSRICGDALHLPFADSVFDLVFCQFTFLWLDVRSAIKEIYRVLQPKGILVAIEPDYGGMIEYPLETATQYLWQKTLIRSGADPFIGRKLPGMLLASDWSVEINLLDRIMPPSQSRYAMLTELPLTPEEKVKLTRIHAADAAMSDSVKVIHLPMFIITAERLA
jgi:SAM-dependent methyltransferase